MKTELIYQVENGLGRVKSWRVEFAFVPACFGMANQFNESGNGSTEVRFLHPLQKITSRLVLSRPVQFRLVASRKFSSRKVGMVQRRFDSSTHYKNCVQSRTVASGRVGSSRVMSIQFKESGNGSTEVRFLHPLQKLCQVRSRRVKSGSVGSCQVNSRYFLTK